jgi:tetratricopeptide (TPR) repeat protein
VTRVVAVGAVAIAVIVGALNYQRIDLSSDRVADQYARDILSGLPANDVLIANGDETIGPLWYARYVEHVRPDVSVVLSSGIPIGWYQDELRAAGLSVPAKANLLTFREANAARPFDFVGPVGTDGSMEGKYYVYRNGLTYNVLPQAVDKSSDDMAKDNTAKLASYHVPSAAHVKARSFEHTIVRDYASVPYSVGDQYHQLKQDDQALIWYQKALAIDPGNSTFEKAIDDLRK